MPIEHRDENGGNVFLMRFEGRLVKAD